MVVDIELADYFPILQLDDGQFETMRANLRASGGFLVLFGELTGEFAPLEEITRGMTLVARFDDGAVYKISP